jgi:Peptidase_C39 like family
MKTIKIATIAKAVTFAAVAGALTLGLASPADAASGTMYGDPAAAAQWWRHQKYDDCVIMSSADVVGQVTGKEPSERAIIKKAQSTPSAAHSGSIYIKPADTKDPNSGMGTMMADVPTLLAQYKVDAVISDKDHAAKTGVPAGMEGLEQLLGAGHKVIVSVNAELIWHQPVEEKDKNGDPRADHAVVVTGVDTANGIVHLNDSGNPKGRDERIPMELFVQAWETSNELIVVTT